MHYSPARRFILTLFGVLGGVFVFASLDSPSGPQARAQGRAPNFIIVYADDMGYADIGPFSTRTGVARPQTPNLDRMAAEGVRLTNFYVAQAVCSASRTALLTGCYSNRVGIQGALGPTATIGINANEVTIAEILKPHGYATAIFGKWHLGHDPQFLPDATRLRRVLRPAVLERHVAAPPATSKDFYPDLPLIDGEKVARLNPDQTQLTTWYTERAVKLHRAKQESGRSSCTWRTRCRTCRCFVSDKFKGKTGSGFTAT